MTVNRRPSLTQDDWLVRSLMNDVPKTVHTERLRATVRLDVFIILIRNHMKRELFQLDKLPVEYY